MMHRHFNTPQSLWESKTRQDQAKRELQFGTETLECLRRGRGLPHRSAVLRAGCCLYSNYTWIALAGVTASTTRGDCGPGHFDPNIHLNERCKRSSSHQERHVDADHSTKMKLALYP